MNGAELAAGGEEGGDAELADAAVIGDEKTVADQLRAFRDAGATDLAAAVVGLDEDREASAERTMQFLADLISELEK